LPLIDALPVIHEGQLQDRHIVRRLCPVRHISFVAESNGCRRRTACTQEIMDRNIEICVLRLVPVFEIIEWSITAQYRTTPGCGQ